MTDRTPRLMDRDRAAELGQETVAILERGAYRVQGESGTEAVVYLEEMLRRAVEGTQSFPPDQPLPPVSPGDRTTAFEVVNETTLEAARRLIESGVRPLALNFASAHHPGGGFLSGSRAQE